MLNLAWSNGIKALRSKQEDNPYLKKTTTKDKKEIVVENNKNTLQSEEIKPRIQVDAEHSLARNTYRKTSNRRETSNDKLSEREMISRSCGNPFLTHLNYTDDIITQERFLMPKNSNMESEYKQ